MFPLGARRQVVRGLGGEMQWLGRQGGPNLAFRASWLAGRYKPPRVAGFKEANSTIRYAKK